MNQWDWREIVKSQNCQIMATNIWEFFLSYILLAPHTVHIYSSRVCIAIRRLNSSTSKNNDNGNPWQPRLVTPSMSRPRRVLFFSFSLSFHIFPLFFSLICSLSLLSAPLYFAHFLPHYMDSTPASVLGVACICGIPFFFFFPFSARKGARASLNWEQSKGKSKSWM